MLRVALAQLNLIVGDISGNIGRILDAIERADADGAQILALPELAIPGYPPEDLVQKGAFLRANRAALDRVAAATDDLVVIVGFVEPDGGRLFNSAAVCQRGEIVAIYRKQLLPNYGVFDEQRYFTSGTDHYLFDSGSAVIGVCICEDAWRSDGPLVSQGDLGAQTVININASPFHKNKLEERERMLCERARRARSSIAYVNMVGGQDELIFDGGSLIIDASGEVVTRFPQFQEHVATVDLPLGESRDLHTSASVVRVPLEVRPPRPATTPNVMVEPMSDAAEVYEALKISLRDYLGKNGFSKVVIGMSGGIDSTLTATIAVDALGPDAVLGVTMPSGFSSSHSVSDSEKLAANLEMELLTIPIAEPYETYLAGLEKVFGPHEMGLAEENLQARIRGTLLMTVSNRYGHLVIATGNKSEMACGYSTLYGDMAGGFALLKDVFKTEVYALARYRNTLSPVIPEGVLTKPPSAELRPGQQDSDSLPSYDVLDPILEAYIEEDADAAEIVSRGFERDVVQKVLALVDRAEYKRRQAPAGPKVTTKAFGRDRRLPITNKWRDLADASLPERVVGVGEPDEGAGP
ncbi:MAG: NAD+ synthase [Actinomycetota bacterium]